MFKKAYGAISFLFLSLVVSVFCLAGGGVAYAAGPTIDLDQSADYTLILSENGDYTLTDNIGRSSTGTFNSDTVVKSTSAASGTLTIKGTGSFALGSIVIAESSSSGGGFNLIMDEGTTVACNVVSTTTDGNANWDNAAVWAKSLTVKKNAALNVTVPSSSFSTYYGVFLRDALVIEGDSQSKGTLSVICTEISSPWVALGLYPDSAATISTISGELDITTKSDQIFGSLFEASATSSPYQTKVVIDGGSINLEASGQVAAYSSVTAAQIRGELTLTNGAEFTIDDSSNYFSSGLIVDGTLSLEGGSKLESSTPEAWRGIYAYTCIMGQEAEIVASSLQGAFACQDLSIGTEGQGSSASINAAGYGLPFSVQNSATIYGSYDKANGTGAASINAELLPIQEDYPSVDYAAYIRTIQAYDTKIVARSEKDYSAALRLEASVMQTGEPAVWIENSAIEAQGAQYGIYEYARSGWGDDARQTIGIFKYVNSSIQASVVSSAGSSNTHGITAAVFSASGKSYFEGSDCNLQAIGGDYGWYGNDDGYMPRMVGPTTKENRVYAQEGAQLYCEGDLCGIRTTDSVKSDSGATITACSRSTEPRGLVSGSISALCVDNLIAYPQDANYFIEADGGTINEQYLTKVSKSISDTGAGAFSPYNLTWNMVSPLNYQWSTQSVSLGIAATEQGIYSTGGTGQPENDVSFMATRQGPIDSLTVTFDAAAGSISSPTQRVMNGHPVSRPSNDSVNTPSYDQALEGWYTDPSYAVKWDFDDPVTQNLTLYAKWDTAVTITYQGYLDGASMWSFDNQAATGQQVPDPSGIQMVYFWETMAYYYSEGATFGGWYTDGTLTIPFDFSTPVTSDTDIYGKWLSISPKPQMTVSFDWGEGLSSSSIASRVLDQGEWLFASDIGTLPTKPGYRFEEWYIDAEFTDPAFDSFYDPDEGAFLPVYEDMTLYARWSSVERVQLLTENSVFNILLVGDFVSQPFGQTYTVSFEPNGGQPKPADQLVSSGMLASEPAGSQKPAKEGFVLGGWYIDGTLTTKWDFSTPVTSNMIFYAKWTGVDPVDPVDPSDSNRIASLSATGDNIPGFALALLSGLLTLIMIGSRILSRRQ